MRKYINIIILLLTFCTSTFAQKVVEHSSKVSPNSSISLDFQFADDIKVTTWNKNEVYVKTLVNINDNRDNDAFRFELNQWSGGLNIESVIENMEDLQKTTITQKTDENGKTKTITTHHLEMDLFFEVKLPKDAMLSIKTISGNIELKGLHKEMKIESISGYVDLSLTANQKADLVLSTITGEMYTDFDLNLKKEKGLQQYIKGKFSKALNGGGEEITLKTISGDIFLRKEK